MSEQIQAAYTVIINLDGTIETQIVDVSEDVVRRATTFDIYQTSKELVSDIESHLLADRVARAVVNAIKPTDETAELKQRLLNALSDRNIEPPQA